MKILVTGAGGQLGREMQRVAGNMPSHTFIYTDVTDEFQKLDITNEAETLAFVEKENVEVIVNCAAYTNVDKAESDEAAANLINNVGPRNLALAAQQCNATLIHISTDYVFQGNGNTPCVETEPANPLGVYGRTKWAGEQSIAATGCKHIIIRTAWLYSKHGKNFLKTMMQLTRERSELKVVFDQVGTPTYAGDLAEAIAYIIATNQYSRQGIYHYSNEGVCSWYDFAVAINNACGNNCRIAPCHSDEFPSPVRRPHYSVLDKTKLKRTFGLKVPYWHTSMLRCIDEIETIQS